MILGFLLTALYVPSIAGAATTPKWALLAVALPLLLFKRSDTKFTIVHLFGALFILWSATSLIWTPNRLDGAGELIKLVILAQAFIFGSRLESLRPVLIGMAAGLILSSVIVLIQDGWPDIVQHSTTHAGLFINSGSLGEITALVLIGLIYYRVWWLALGLLPCIILPASRGAWLTLAAAFTVWLWGKSKLSALALMALTGICITYSLHLGFHVESVTQRLDMWRDAVGGLNWLGYGLGSFWTDYAPLAMAVDIFVQRPEHLHNDWLEIVFEQGITGVLLLAGFSWCVFRRSASTLGYAILAGFFAEGLVGFPLHMPCTAFVAALCLGHLARERASLRDLFHARRGLLRGGRTRHRRGASDYAIAQECGSIPA